MTPDLIVELLQQSLLLALLIAAPPLLAVFAVALIVGIVQALTGIQDPAIGQIPRFFVAVAALAIASPWIFSELTAFAELAYTALETVQH